jgi:hypothetical protein
MHEMLKTPYSSAMGRTQRIERFYQLKPGETVEDSECSKSCSTDKKCRLHTIINEDQ